mmetsp:Transcript_1161/g.5151  ORF Transcript_1161/g.5151 Transcript_1161/m.5151 type:complete len:222 (-) Transcript_1161:272-937(-)
MHRVISSACGAQTPKWVPMDVTLAPSRDRAMESGCSAEACAAAACPAGVAATAAASAASVADACAMRSSALRSNLPIFGPGGGGALPSSPTLTGPPTLVFLACAKMASRMPLLVLFSSESFSSTLARAIAALGSSAAGSAGAAPRSVGVQLGTFSGAIPGAAGAAGVVAGAGAAGAGAGVPKSDGVGAAATGFIGAPPFLFVVEASRISLNSDLISAMCVR